MRILLAMSDCDVPA